MPKTYDISLTVPELEDLEDFIQLWLLPAIKQDEGISEIEYVESLINVYHRVRSALWKARMDEVTSTPEWERKHFVEFTEDEDNAES